MRHHIVKNEISIGDKLQPNVKLLEKEYLGKSVILDEVINYFTEISYHLPAIYNIEVKDISYWPSITFQSHATNGFIYRLVGNAYEDKLESIEIFINHCETFDSWTESRSYISIDCINTNMISFKTMIKCLKAIMRNPTVAAYLAMKYPYNGEELFNDKHFTYYIHEGIDTAVEYCKQYFIRKREVQILMNHVKEEFEKNFYRIAKKYNNQIYKMAYKINNYCDSVITIRTRANLYYGDDDRYTQFVKEINSTVINGYYKWCDKIDEFENRNPDCKKIYTFGPKVVIDEIDNDNAYVPYWSLSLRKHSIKYPLMKHYYKDIVFPKRSV